MKTKIMSCALWIILSLPGSALSALAQSNSYHENNSFQFAIKEFHSERQSGQTVNIYVRFAYKEGLPTSEYVDYRLMRQRVMDIMEPSDTYPANLYWEVLATAIGKTLMKEFPIEGVSVQLDVVGNEDPTRYEPGDHGPIFSMGRINPLAVTH